MAADTTPAVSVLSLVFPIVTGIKWFCIASSISVEVKSPSGPIHMIWELMALLATLARLLLFSFRQCAMNFC